MSEKSRLRKTLAGNLGKEIVKTGKGLDFRPLLHSQQLEVWNTPARFIVLVCGAGWGKTHFAARWLVSGALETGKLCQWIAPSYELSTRGWDAIAGFMVPDMGEPLISAREWKLINGRVQLRSADDPNAIVGRHIPYRVIEEASFMPDEVYDLLRARVLITEGKLLFIFTPRGKGHWTYELYQWGLDKKRPEWASYHFPQSPQTLFEIATLQGQKTTQTKVEKEFELARRDMEKRNPLKFREEILAEFLSESANVFKDVRKHAISELKQPEMGKRYVLGVDIGQLQDFTVLYVMDEERAIRFTDRFIEVPYPVLTDRIAQVSQNYNGAAITIDSTGLGKPVYDELVRKDGIGEVIPYVIGNAKMKEDLIAGLMGAFDSEKLQIPQMGDDPQLIYELETFEYQYTSFGNIKFHAPRKKKDDCVIALALADFGYRQKLAPGEELMYWI